MSSAGYPKQRSQGVRWFISFYLQLKASEKDASRKVFLMDEPGANLHPKAQEDVLRLINRLSKDIQIVYSTHNSSLLEYEKLYRVHAVQRDGDMDESPTTVIDAHRLGAASQDTLTPVLVAMGVNLSSQEVVKRRRNVLLEEISGFYYLKAFWKLTECEEEAYFIAASGASNIPVLANLFLGWGLRFIVVVDDDTRGRGVYRDLKRDHYGDSDELAAKFIWKISGCTGIEDAFAPSDFVKHILRDESVRISGKNTDYLRNAGRSKPVIAYQFWMDVQSGAISKDTLELATLEKLKSIVNAIGERLKNA